MKWKPLQEAALPPLDQRDPTVRANVIAQMARDGLNEADALAKIEKYETDCEYWRNDLYQVQLRRFHNEIWDCEMVHLNIRRIDGAAIFDWRHRQLIKNQLVGAECEAFEIYPAESRLVDTSNKYHLWCFTDPAARIPVAIDDGSRDVIEGEVRSPAGHRQRRIMR
jgi:hypothetical protein